MNQYYILSDKGIDPFGRTYTLSAKELAINDFKMQLGLQGNYPILESSDIKGLYEKIEIAESCGFIRIGNHDKTLTGVQHSEQYKPGCTGISTDTESYGRAIPLHEAPPDYKEAIDINHYKYTQVMSRPQDHLR